VILAVDQGTTGTTCLTLDRDLRVVGRGYRELPQHFPRPGWVEHDPEEIWTSVVEAAAEAGGDPDTVAITNQRETTILWERATGKPVAPAIVWQDRRTADRCRELDADLIRSRTGLVPDPYFSATKLEWLLREQGGREGLAFGTVDSYLVWRLTGGEQHVIDVTNASRTLLVSLETLDWDDELLELFGVPRDVLPRIVGSAETVGEGQLLGRTMTIRGIAGDQQAALYGQGCTTAGAVKNTYGTGCFLMAFTGSKRVASKHGLLTTVACSADGGAAYALEGSVFIAGAGVQWLRDELGVIPTSAHVEALARTVPDTLGTHFVPAFVGLGAPHWDADARGAWLGLTRGAGRAHLARAVLEAIAWQSRDLLDAVIDDGAPRPRELRVDGGAAANDLLMQMQADFLGLPIARPALIETTALGAGLLAAQALGWKDAGRAARKVAKRYAPRMDRSEREQRLKAWRRAVEAARAATRP